MRTWVASAIPPAEQKTMVCDYVAGGLDADVPKVKERLPEDGSRPWLCRYIISRGWFCVKSLSLLPGGVPEQDRV